MSFISNSSFPRDTRVVLFDFPCDPSLVAGEWVRVDATNTAVKAQADTLDNANVIGLVEEKTSTTTANILVLGVSKEIFTSLDTSKEYYLSSVTAGAMQLAPVTTASGTVVLKVGQPATDKRFLVLKGIRMVRA